MKKKILSFFLAAIMIFSLCAVAVPYVMAADLKTSEKGIQLIKDMEGFSAKAYYDNGQYTIGYGTRCPDDMLEEYKENGFKKKEKAERKTAKRASPQKREPREGRIRKAE